MKVLVTGAAGFIGMHVAQRLLARGDEVVGIDNLNDYYDVRLKQARLAQLAPHANFRFIKLDLCDRAGIEALFDGERFARVIHLAAQAGVRYSIDNPQAYVESNITGFLHILEGCRHHPVEHLVYASSSSVYGGNTKLPFSESDGVDHPVSLYAATKKANELMAHTYSHLYRIPATGLRFFTVYGPWGRPDMAPMKFAAAILEGRAIDVYNHGDMSRDFTYIDDIVEGVLRVAERAPQPDGGAPYSVLNIGASQPERLMDFIGTLEKAFGRTVEKRMLPMQPGDVPATYADVSAIEALTGFRPQTGLQQGVKLFADWYLRYRETAAPR